jgi:hypothetical protein
MYGQPRFSEVTQQQVIGALKATGSTDPDVLVAALDQFAAPYRPLKWFGIWGMVTGALCTAFIILAFIGIPIFIFGIWAFRRAKKNARTIEAAWAQFNTGLGLPSPSAEPLVPGHLRAMGLGALFLVVLAGAVQVS